MRRWTATALVCLALGAPLFAWAQLPIRSYLLQNAATANGNGLVAHAAGFTIANVQVVIPTGASPSFQVNFEQSLNDNHYQATMCQHVSALTMMTSSTTPGQWRCNVAGATWFRSRISGYGGSGSVTVLGTLIGGQDAVLGVVENQPAGSQTVNQGGVWSVLAHAFQSGSWTIQGAHVFQSGSWTVQASHQGGAWNIDKISHVTSAMAHVVGTVTIEGRGTGGSAAGGVVSVQGVASGTVVPVSLSNAAVNQSGSWTIQAVHQGGTAWNVAHVSSATHVVGSVRGALACHSTVGIAQSASSIVAHGSGMFIEICGVILANASAATQQVSLVEGTGAACGTGTAALLGGIAASFPLAVPGVLSAVAMGPWMRTTTIGNNVCVIQSGTDRIAGTLSYRGVASP